MRTGPALFVLGAVMLGACAAQPDVQSTASSASDSGEQLPPVDDPAVTPNREATTTTTTVPGTRPVDFDSKVLVGSDLPGWDVVRPMDVAGEPTWEALDCPDMNQAWGVTGLAGTRSRGTNGGASFRNTAVEFATTEEAADVLDAVDRVWTECTLFEADLGSFWSEPIVMPPSTLRTSGLVIGGDDISQWTLAYWQDDTMVITLEVEGDEMWTYLDPLLTTLSARLDGMPTQMETSPTGTITSTAPQFEAPRDNLPVLVPATMPPVELPATTSTTTTTIDPQHLPFPPLNAEWAEHPLARLAPAPSEVGPEWDYEGGNRIFAGPADPDDTIEGCDAQAPPDLDGFEVDYRNIRTDAQIALMVGDSTAGESQMWVDAFRALVGCDVEQSNFNGAFNVIDQKIDDVDDGVILAGEWDFDAETTYVLVIGVARIDGTMVIASVVVAVTDAQTTDVAVAQVGDLLAVMLAAR